jgi:hypothetical protein
MTPLNPEEELRSIRTFVGTIAHGIGQLQHTLQRSQTQWHFNHIVGQLSQLSQELTGQVEQTTSLYTLLVRLLLSGLLIRKSAINLFLLLLLLLVGCFSFILFISKITTAWMR